MVKSPQNRIKRILFVPDCHHPYCDDAAWEVMINAGKHFKPDQIIVLGDFMDCYSVSTHSKDPRRIKNFETELIITNTYLDKLDALKASKKVYIMGNHEDRLDRYIADKASELCGLVSIRKLLHLDKRGWDTINYKDHCRIGKIYCTHDTGKCGPNAHSLAQNDFQANVVIGHTHRLGYVVTGNARGDAHVAAMFGWLGSFEQADYMHRIKAMREWALGFGIGYMEQSGIVHLVPVPIVNYSCIIEGRKVSRN